jgi:hypothetical protein
VIGFERYRDYRRINFISQSETHGFPMDTVDEIFSAFVTPKQQGIGVNSIVRQPKSYLEVAQLSEWRSEYYLVCGDAIGVESRKDSR